MNSRDDNLFSHFRTQFQRQTVKTALTTDSGEHWRYTDLERRSAAMANGLHGLGLAPGDRVSVQVAKSPDALCLYLACLRAGLVYHPLNPAYTSAELEYFFSDAEPSLVVCDPQDLGTVEVLARKAGVATVMTLGARGDGSFAELAASGEPDFPVVARANDEMAALLYSSGTTGVPKGITLTHGNLLSNAQTLVRAWEFSHRDVLLHALPMFHVHGLFVATSCALLPGASMRWLADYAAPSVVRALPECTVMMGVPTYYTRLLAQASFTKEAAANMRLFISGSAPLREETFHEFEARTGHRILERYGMSETGMNTSNPLHGARKPGTVGPPLAGVELRVGDSDKLSLPVGEVGNVQVKGPNVFAGYWKLPDKTAEDFTADGFFNTGDKGRIDADGYLTIVGRAKDLVISGGLNVYPREVETVIDEVPGVKESAVIGVPHPDFGEAVVAVIVTTGTSEYRESAVFEVCRSRLANYKQPKIVVEVDELPRNSMAKVQKNRLRQTYADLFVPEA